MKKTVTSPVRTLARSFGFDVVRHQKNGIDPHCDFNKENREIFRAVGAYTMTSLERVNALIEAVRYVVKCDIEGDMVECGVWKGGSSMAMALTLKKLGVEDRDIHLYDTFSGMNAPTDEDVSVNGINAKETFFERKQSDGSSEWCTSPIDKVKANVQSTGYPLERMHFIKGKVEDTIPVHLPKKVSILRLDTDWYESTKHELIHLFPLLEQHGVLIIDDYGHWQGARKAVDEYIAENNIRVLLNRIDYTGRIGIKTD